jgi:N,N'-diacetyllegionaminate synthase
VHTKIIAEIGVNHNKDILIAKKLIDVAVDCGADIVKFQTALPEEDLTAYADLADYQKESNTRNESQLEMAKKIHFDFEVFHELKDYSEKKQIEFLTTSFGPKGTKFISTLGLKRYKIPSGEATNLPYLRIIASFKKPVLLSTGMCNLGEIEAAIDTLISHGLSIDEITVLHCNTEYPTPMKDANLKAIQTIKNAFNVGVGYSDHTPGIEAAIAAVALGATVIEKHITLDKTLAGPDHMASSEPDEFSAMVKAIRNIEVALGSGIKRPSISELKNIAIVRKSIIATKKISKGDLLSEDNLGVKRPGSGLSPNLWDLVIGKIAAQDFLPDEQITL